MPESDASTRKTYVADPELLFPELAQVLLATSPVEEALSELASVAANAVIPPASCGITLRRNGRPTTVSSSDDLASAVDEIQYDRDQGPCLQSLATGYIINVPDVAAETRWGGYPAHALAHGVGSSLSLPLSHQDHPVGALNLYAATPRAFDGADNLARATAVAGQVEAVLSVVLRQADLVKLTDELKAALTSRSAIDQAIGIMMAQQRCTAGEAFDILRSASQHRNRKLRDGLPTSSPPPPANHPNHTRSPTPPKPARRQTAVDPDSRRVMLRKSGHPFPKPRDRPDLREPHQGCASTIDQIKSTLYRIDLNDVRLQPRSGQSLIGAVVSAGSVGA
jgi:hypothetical protein